MVRVKRAYEPAEKGDGTRILVDRLWPRGVSKEKARIDRWLKELAPSTELRTWFGHDPERWTEFERRYRKELNSHSSELKEIAEESRSKAVTLIYAAKDEWHNEAVVLRDIIDRLAGVDSLS